MLYILFWSSIFPSNWKKNTLHNYEREWHLPCKKLEDVNVDLCESKTNTNLSGGAVSLFVQHISFRDGC